MIAKQQAKGEQTYPVFLNAVEKYDKVENTNTQNDYKITQKRQIKRTYSLCFVNVFEFKERKSRLFKRISRK